VSWDAPAGSGTVTSIATAGGIAGGPITGSGTISLDEIATASVLGNVSGSDATPGATSVSALLDAALGSGRGQIIYRGAAGWAALGPGTSGYFLQTRGSGADPTWGNVKGGGGAAVAPSLWNEACDLATTAALPACTYANGSAGVGATLTATANGALAVDGLMVVGGDRVLVKDQASLQHNGAYVVTATGSGAAPFVLTRAADYDQASTEIIQGSAFPITAGDTLDSTAWVLITGGTITVGTTPLEFEALTATMPICGPGQVLGNPLSVDAPAVPMDPAGGGGGGGAAGHPGYASGFYYNRRVSEITQNAAVTTTRIYATPIEIGAAVTISAVQVNVTVGSASGAVQIGIYNNANGRPSTLLRYCGSASTVSTGATDIAVSQALAADWYWLALIVNQACNFASSHADDAILSNLIGHAGITNSQTGAMYVYSTVAFSAGSMPGTFVVDGIGLTQSPIIAIKIA